MALCKWDSWIGLQPITVHSDHHSLQHWHSEAIGTPSGPSGRKGRWHELLSKFNLTVLYIPGKDNIVAEAMSRWAYPASKSFQDVSMHGSPVSKVETEREIQLERERERCTASPVPGESNFASQALSFADSEGGLITHLEETLDGLPVTEGDEDNSHWVELEPPATHVKLQETRLDHGGAGVPSLTRGIATSGANQHG